MMKTTMNVKAALFMFTALLASAFLLGLPGRLVDPKLCNAATARSAQLQDEIQAELKVLGDHPWAGEYYEGDGTGENVSLMLAPKAGYVFEWHGCLGLYDRNYGKVTEGNGRLRLSFTFPNVREGFQGIAEEFIPVSWGERRYLIPGDKVVDFCNAVNEGREPRTDAHGFFLMRDGDEARPAIGLPAVPEPYRKYLRPQAPIEARIVGLGTFTTRPSLGDWKFKDTPLTLDVGAKGGLLVGMRLHVIDPRNTYEDVKITKVEADTSSGVMTQIGEHEAGPELGWHMSTRRRP